MATRDPPQAPQQAAVFFFISGLVACGYGIPLADWLFCIFFSAYLFLMNSVRFNHNRKAIEENIPLTTLGKAKFIGDPGFESYMKTAVLGTVLLPGLTLLIACHWRHETLHPIAAPAAPHLFVLLVQVAMEHLTYRKSWHDLPRILVPIGFSIWRERTMWIWAETVITEVLKSTCNRSIEYIFICWIAVLAVFNMIFYSYNLFFFLLMRMTPHYLDPKECPSPKVQWPIFVWPVVVHGERATQKKL